MSKGIFKKLCLVFVLFTLLLAACTQAGEAILPVTAEEILPTDTDQPSELTVLKMGYLPIISFAPVFIAIEKGYFAEQGLEIQLESFRSGAETVAPLCLGQLDIGGSEVGTTLFNAVNQGMNVRAADALGSMREGNAYLVLVVRTELYESGEVTTVADLAGRKVAINNIRGVMEYMLAKTLEHGDLTIADVEPVQLAYPDMVQALANGAIDAAIISYPLAGNVISVGENGEPPIGVLLLSGEKMTPDPQIGVLYFGQRLLQPENEELGVRFLAAILKAYRDLQGDAWRSDQTIIQAISKYTKVDEAVVKEAVLSYFDPNGRINEASVKDIQEYMVRNGYTEYGEPMPFTKIVELRFLEKAVEQLGEY